MPTSANVTPKAIKGDASILSYYSASSSNEPSLVNQYRLINPKANVQSSTFIFLLENSLDKVSPFEDIDVNVFNKVEVRGAAQIAHERLPGALSDTSAAHFFDFPPSGREKSVSLRRFLRENQIIASKGYGARVRVSVNFP